MTDSDAGALKTLVQAIGPKLKEYFDVRRERAENKIKFDKKQSKLTAKYAKADEPLARREEELAAALRELIIPGKLLLISGKIKSVATTFGNISFASKPVAYRVIDARGFEAKARKERRLNQLGQLVKTWKPNAKNISKWLQSDQAAAKRYAPFVERVGGYDELSVKPNAAYLTDFDPNRLTEQGVNLGPAPDPVRTQAPTPE